MIGLSGLKMIFQNLDLYSSLLQNVVQ